MRTKKEIMKDFQRNFELKTEALWYNDINEAIKLDKKLKELSSEMEKAKDEDYTPENLLNRMELLEDGSHYVYTAEGDFLYEPKEGRVRIDIVGMPYSYLYLTSNTKETAAKALCEYLLNIEEEE